MKNVLTTFLASVFIFSCGENKTEYLYDKYDSRNYQAALAAKQKECETTHKIFENLDAFSDFSKFFEKKSERIFRIHRKKSTDGGEKKDHYIYVRMDKNEYDPSASPKTLKLHIVDSEGGLNSSDFEHRYKTVIYSQQDNKDILSTIMKGVCSPQKGAYTLSGGWNNELISFTDTREEKSNTSKDYTSAKETLTAKIGYPLIFFRWNGTKTFEKKIGTTETKWSYEMAGNDAIKEIEIADCNEDSLCENLFSTLQTCQLEVDKTHFLATDPQAQMVSFKSCELK